MTSIPQSTDILIIGAGIHGLSTALHMAQKKPGTKITIVEKTTPGAGATGIACGVVRNNYFQPAMREIMAHSVGVWEKYQKELSYHPVGYMQISMEAMHEDVNQIYQEQKSIGYTSDFIEGEKDCHNYMANLFDDWQAKGITSVLHEKRGGFANNLASVDGLTKLAKDAGVEIITGVEVTGFNSDSKTAAIKSVETKQGIIKADQIVVAVGPWIKYIWDMLDLPSSTQIKDSKGNLHDAQMWKYWMLQEGVLDIDSSYLSTNDNTPCPVIHVDSDQPLVSDITGEVLDTDPWGIYYKPDPHFGGIQGGYAPYPLTADIDSINIDPYADNGYVVTESFKDKWCSALAACQKRFEGKRSTYKDEPSGGLGCLTPDSFPIFDRFRENVYIIADANHGYKMLGIGELVADELLGQNAPLLDPFRFSRYFEGKLHPLSNSPFPWS